MSITANDPRPLDQAAMALHEYYGCKLDYEDPIYSAEQVTDKTDPGWLKNHPGAKRVTVPAGGMFTAPYPDNTSAPVEMTTLIDAIVQQYNSTPNVPQFATKFEAESRVAILPAKGSILDIEMTLPKGPRSLSDEISLILRTLSSSSGQAVTIGSLPAPSIWANHTFVDDGKTATARARLLAALTSIGYPVVWRMLYDYDQQEFFFNLFVADPNSPITRRNHPLPLSN